MMMASRPNPTRATRRWHLASCAIVLTLVATMTVACTPTSPPDPTNIVNMTDEVAAATLADDLPDFEKALADPAVLADIPEENRPYVNSVLADMRTPEGRLRLAKDLRDTAYQVQGGFLPRRDTFAGGLLGSVVGLSEGIAPDTTLHGTRYVAPTTITGTSVGFETTSGNCSAPGGPGQLPAPASLVANQHLTPQHDVYTTFTTGPIGTAGPLNSFTPAGVPTIAGNAGVELRGSGFAWQMHVQVDIQDVNDSHLPVAALLPIFRIRPIGGTPAQETQVQPVEGSIKCYAGDAPESTRAYFDGWIPVPHAEPGFQLITEVVENDYYFRFGGGHFDALLSGAGPAFFAGADRSTIHVGPAPVTSSQPISHAVGAFATALPDGTAGPNLLTDTNGATSDDLEATIRGLLSSKVRGALNDGMSGDLAQYYALTVQGAVNNPPTADVDLKYVDPHTSFPDVTGEPVGTAKAIEAKVSAKGDADMYMQLLGVPCFGVSMHVDLELTADVWADSAGPNTSINVKSRHTSSNNVDLDMPWYDWLIPNCVIMFGLVHAKAASKIPNEVDGAIDDALGSDGAITKILSGFDLNDYLPTIAIDPIAIGNTTTGGATVRPVVTNLDNAWCRASGAPAGCTVDQDLLGAQGLEVAADTSLVASLTQALGGSFGGRFPNVFAPTLGSSVDNLVTSHRDAQSQMAGLGVVLDGRLVNIALRHLAQGRATGTTTNGLIDIVNYQTPVDAFSVTTRPEVAPMVTAVPPDFTPLASRPTVAAVAPDVRLSLRTSPSSTKSIRYSVAASDNIGLAFDPSINKVSPTFDSPVVDIQTTGGCQVNYVSGYAASYLLCGRGSGGNGGNISSLNDVLDAIANQVIKPVLDETVGGIQLPTLDALLPNLHLALANVRFQARGGFLALYADLRPFPVVSLVGSTAGYGGDDDTIRFFAVPTNFTFDATTSFAWEITDGVTNQPVAFTPYPGAMNSAIQFPSNAFTQADQVDKRKTVKGKLTVTKPGLEVKGTGSFSWTPPGPPQPPNCPGPAPHPAVISTGGFGGLGGGHYPGTIGCF